MGVLALVALVVRGSDPVAALMPRGSWAAAAAMGVAGAAGSTCVLLLLLWMPAMRDLERWQGALVRDWSVADAFSVALLSGLAEEALLRAFLQAWIGLLPAAALFAALHLVPDRRLWMWPVVALAMGIVFGLLFARWGYPAAALAHILVNLAALLRLRGRVRGEASP